VDKSSICDPSVELTLAGSRLSSRLTQYKVVLILLAPQVKSDAEFKEMLSLFYRPQICTFVEAVDTSLMEFCHRHHSTGSSRPVIKLSIGGVAQKDGIEYKNDRIELLRRQNPANVIEFPDSVMRHFFAERMSNSIGMSVLELERVCRHAFERARLRGDTKIEYSDLVNFYMAYFHGT
jgi:hypothetical protein